ncbi:MAG: TlpA family protein disulfide reductase [Candidatus Porifericomitaceae bacterium WSBS_2022_MAG_OTU9]
MKRADILTIGFIIAIGGFIGGSWYRISSHPDKLPAVDIQTSTAKVPLYSLLQQDKYMLLNFWSVSCGPCIQEIPHLKRMHQQHGDKLTILAVAMEYDPPNLVLDQAKDLPYQVALDLDGRMAQKLGAYFTPTYLLVSPDGRILDKKIGAMDFAALLRQLEKTSPI